MLKSRDLDDDEIRPVVVVAAAAPEPRQLTVKVISKEGAVKVVEICDVIQSQTAAGED